MTGKVKSISDLIFRKRNAEEGIYISSFIERCGTSIFFFFVDLEGNTTECLIQKIMRCSMKDRDILSSFILKKGYNNRMASYSPNSLSFHISQAVYLYAKGSLFGPGYLSDHSV